MTNPIKLTLGQAAKEVGISKPSLSAAIKKGRVSAYKNESGTYEIDPAELYRVYPPKANTNGLANSKALPPVNPKANGVSQVQSEVLDLLLAERDKLIAEKEKAIQRLEQEKDALRNDLEDQKDQAKRITLLLEDKTTARRAGGWEKSLKVLEQRIANQEKAAKAEKEKALKIERQNKALRKALKEERSRGLWERLFPTSR